MRKRMKNKKRSCALCKPHKRGISNRWTHKQFFLLVDSIKEIRNSMKTNPDDMNK